MFLLDNIVTRISYLNAFIEVLFLVYAWKFGMKTKLVVHPHVLSLLHMVLMSHNRIGVMLLLCNFESKSNHSC